MREIEEDFIEEGFTLREGDRVIGSAAPYGGSWAVKNAKGEILAMRPDGETAKKALLEWANAQGDQ